MARHCVFAGLLAGIALAGPVPGALAASPHDIYMGAPVEIVTLPNGIRMNAQQREGSIGVLEKSISEVADGVWAIMGYSVVHIYAVRAPEGLIIIDTGVSAAEARAALAALRTKTGLPVRAIVHTHKHYMAGSGVFAEGRPVTVVGHPADVGVKETVRGAFAEIRPAQMARGIQQMGGVLPVSGPDSAAGFRIAPPPPGERAAPPPLAINHPAIDGSEFMLAGMRVQTFSAHASDDDSVTLWLPERRIAFNNFYWPVAANLFAPRGDAFRDVRSWMGGLRQLRGLKPLLVLSTHARPLSGEKNVEATLGKYIDYHQVLFDQTLRGILKGVGPEDIRDFVDLPKAYADIRQAYGETGNWYPQAIYGHAFGWYSGDAAELNPVSARFRHAEITRLLGGIGRVLALARKAEQKGQFAWALELVNHAHLADPGNGAARAAKARLLRRHAELTPASISHNFYMAQARALEGKGAAPIRMYDLAGLTAASACSLIDQYRIRVVPERTLDRDGLVAFRFADGTECGLHVRNGLAEFVADVAAGPAAPLATIHLNREQLVTVFSGQAGLDRLAVDPAVTVTGDRDGAARLGEVFEVLPAD